MQLCDATQDFPFKLWQRMAAASLSGGGVPNVVCDPQLKQDLEQGLVASHDCVVVAAGIGSRMKADRPKQYLDLAGHSLLEWTVCQILQSPLIRRVVLVLHPEDTWFAQTILAQNPAINERLTILHGGKERVDSVCCGLKAVESTWCLVHDAARPFTHVADLEKLIKCAIQGSATPVEVENSSKLEIQGAILASPETDTLKRIHGHKLHLPAISKDAGTKAWPLILQTEDRSQIYRAQTPQMFKTQYLLQAITSLQQQGKLITDEASVVDFVEHDSAILVEGSSFNFKLTTPNDLLLAHALIDFMQSH